MNDYFPTVDIIIAASNESRSIDACLNAVTAQRYPQAVVNVYVIDNGSTDGTAALVRRHDVRLLSVAAGTIGAVRNAGIRAGRGEILATLDAHSIACEDWLMQITRPFADLRTGACQGALKFEFENAALRDWMRSCGLWSDKQVSGWVNTRSSPYPFVVTGNAAFRRSAAEQVGLFDETLTRAEDLDLSWMLLFAGYQITFRPQAVVEHTSDDTWLCYLRKQFGTSRSMARVARKYGLIADQGKSCQDSELPASPYRTDWKSRTLGLVADAGMCIERLSMAVGLTSTPPTFSPTIAEYLRASFAWGSKKRLAFSRESVYWQSDQGYYVVVNVPKKRRLVLADSAAAFFERITRGQAREQIVTELAKQFDVGAGEIACDLDEFVAELMREGILVSEPEDVCLPAHPVLRGRWCEV